MDKLTLYVEGKKLKALRIRLLKEDKNNSVSSWFRKQVEGYLKQK